MEIQTDIRNIITEAVDKAARETLAVSREKKYKEVSNLFASLEKKMEAAIYNMRSDMNNQFDVLEEKLHDSIKQSLSEYKTNVENVENRYIELDKKTVKYDLAVKAIFTVSSVILLAVVAKVLGVINL
jgi:exonuclease VII large subunit